MVKSLLRKEARNRNIVQGESDHNGLVDAAPVQSPRPPLSFRSPDWQANFF